MKLWQRERGSKYFLLFVAGLLLIATCKVSTREHEKQEVAKKALATILVSREKEQSQAKRLIQQKEHELTRLRIQVSRNERFADKVNEVLHGTVIAGYGFEFIKYGEETAVLRAAVCRWELGVGATGRNAGARAKHNPGGLMRGGKLITFATWEDGIRFQAELITRLWPRARRPEELRGYCSPDHPWMENVEKAMRRGN